VKKQNVTIFIVLVAVLLVLIGFESSYGWKLRSLLAPGLPMGAATQNDNPSLVAENEALQAQLDELKGVAAILPKATSGDIPAMVYSRYPFNFKNEFLVDAGAHQGVEQGNAVTFQGIFIGTVEQVFPDSSLVQTVFDTSVKLPVRVGASGSDALFVGGASPMATSIEKKAPVAPGDVVYSAAPGIPYDLPIAIVASTGTSPDDLFMNATLSFAYDINSIETVLIAK